MSTVPTRRNFLHDLFDESNGLFYDSDNDSRQRQWVKVVLADNYGETSVLTMSSKEMRILCKQFRAICDEHGWDAE